MATELEELVVRLTGEMSGYIAMLKNAETATKDTAEKIEARFSEKLNQVGMAAVATGAALTAAFGGAAHEAFSAWSEAESIGIRLNATLEAQGRDVRALTEDYNDFALTMQKTTTAEDDAVLSMLATAEGLQATGDAAKKAVKDALALAAATGASEHAAIRLTAALAKGDVDMAQMYSRAIPGLRGVKDETEFLSRALKLTAAGEKALAAEANTASGAIKMLKNDFGNFQEEIGKVIAEGLLPFVQWAKDVVGWLASLSEGTKKAIAVVLGLGAGLGALLAIVGGATLAWSALGTALTAAAPIVAAVVVVAALTYAVYKLSGAEEALAYVERGLARDATQYTKVLDTRKAVIAQVTKQMKEMTNAVLEQSKAASGDDKKSFLSSNIDKAREEVDKYKQRVEEAQKAMEKAEGFSGTRNMVRDAKRQMKEANELLEAAKDNVKKLQEEMDKTPAGPGGVNPKAVAAVSELEAKLREQVNAIGKTSIQTDIEKVATTEGVTAAMLENAKAMAHTLEQSELVKKAEEKAAASAKELIDSLKTEGATYGMTANAKKLHQAAADGVSEATLAEARALMAKNAELEKFYKLAEKGKGIADGARTPLQKFQEDVEALQAALKAGSISEDEYISALAQVEGQYGKVAKEADKAAKEIGKFDAAMAGSAEAASRIEAFQDLLRGGTDGAALKGKLKPDKDQIAGGKINVPGGNNPEAFNKNQERGNILLQEIRELLRGEAKKRGVKLEPANLEK